MTLKNTLRAHNRLIIINALVAMLIATRFFSFLPNISADTLGSSFVVLSTFSHMAMLAALLGWITLPLLLLPPRLYRPLTATIAALGLALLFADTLVFAQYRFHINTVVLELILSGQVVDFPLSMWLMTVGAIATVVLIEWLLLSWFNRPSRRRQHSHLGRNFAALVAVAFLLSSALHIWAAAHTYQPVTAVKRYLPMFYPISANSMMKKRGWVNEEELERQKSLTLKRQNGMNYPLAPLTYAPVEKPLNIMLLVIDSWRADTFNADNTPNLWRYAQQGVQFSQHHSTGNSTRTGIFGLFYGLPGTYWQGMVANQISPVLMDRLQALDYQLGIFASAQLRKPEFNQTVFAKVPDLRLESKGNTPAERDIDLTQDWLSWNAQQDPSRPKFSFLFYDAPHGYDFPTHYPHHYEPMLAEVNYLQLNNNTDPEPFLNRYKNSVHFVDDLIAQVLDTLQANNELDHTLIIITGDHAQEINDNGLNYWGHNSNFTDAQVKVPLILIGPDVNPAHLGHSPTQLTSHEDIAPTLLQHYLGVTSPVAQYSVGVDLFNTTAPRDWVLASSYSDYALITADTILHINAAGQHQLLDHTNRSIDGKPNFSYLQQALEHMSRFYK